MTLTVMVRARHAQFNLSRVPPDYNRGHASAQVSNSSHTLACDLKAIILFISRRLRPTPSAARLASPRQLSRPHSVGALTRQSY